MESLLIQPSHSKENVQQWRTKMGKLGKTILQLCEHFGRLIFQGYISLYRVVRLVEDILLLTLQEELRFRIRSFYCDIICNFKSTNSVPRPDGPPCIYLDPTWHVIKSFLPGLRDVVRRVQFLCAVRRAALLLQVRMGHPPCFTGGTEGRFWSFEWPFMNMNRAVLILIPK